MRLPQGDRAIVNERKVIDYCLSKDHDEGKHKARLFRPIVGITLDNADRLLDQLREAAACGEATLGKLDRYGER